MQLLRIDDIYTSASQKLTYVEAEKRRNLFSRKETSYHNIKVLDIPIHLYGQTVLLLTSLGNAH